MQKKKKMKIDFYLTSYTYTKIKSMQTINLNAKGIHRDNTEINTIKKVEKLSHRVEDILNTYD